MNRTAWDIDGVLCNFVRDVYIPTANQLFNKNYPVDYIPKEWNLYKGLTTEDEDAQIWASPLLNRYILTAKPIKKTLRMIEVSTHPIFVTSRGTYASGALRDDARSATEEWLHSIGLAHVPLHFVKSDKKVEFAMRHGVTTAWEDKPETVLDYADHGIVTFMPLYEYNRDVPIHEGVVRVEGLCS